MARSGDTQISDEAVKEATGSTWEAWFERLDAWGAAEREHAAIAAQLTEEHGLSGWWAQMVTVQYERARGLRQVGESADGTYQVGVQRTVPIEVDDAWELLLSAPGLSRWLGPGAPKELVEGETYRLDDGTEGEVRVVKPGSHVRLTWQPPGWARASTVQVRAEPRKTGTALGFHQEGLPDAKAREAMRAHWREVVARLAP